MTSRGRDAAQFANEPGSAALALLGFGAAGLLAWRKRKAEFASN